jgi:adenosine deaminase
MRYPREFIQQIPKTDLHLHLDGSLRLSSLIEMARENGVTLPSFTEDGLRELVFKERYADLGQYLQGFRYTTAVLQTDEALERAAFELAEDNAREGVRYIEVRFAPQLHINGTLNYSRVLKAVDRGLAKASSAANASIRTSGDLPFNYGIIVCAMRMFRPEFSGYFGRLFDLFPYSSDIEIYRNASLELAKAACAIRDTEGVPIVGFDLAGQENGYPASDHGEAYEYCHRHFMKKTVHAGEAYGAASIFQAITDLHANRIGHGYYLFDESRISGTDIPDRTKYIQDLSNYIADRRITMEVCLTSNMQTNPSIASLRDHSLGDMLKNGLSVSICTDNRLVSGTTVTDELLLALDNFDIPPKQLKDIIIYGFKRSFYPGSYMEKRRYCRQVIDRYQRLEKEFGVCP